MTVSSTVSAGSTKQPTENEGLSHDRLFRDLFNLERYGAKLKQNGIRVSSIADPFRNHEPGSLTQNLVAAITEWQSRVNAEHIIRNRIANARCGNFNGGIPPF